MSALWAKAKAAFAAKSHTHDYLPLSGGVVKGQLRVNSTAADRGLMTRSISGNEKEMVDACLYIQYKANAKTYIGNDAVYYFSESGATYTGTANAAKSVPWSGVTGKAAATQSEAGLMSAADKAKLDGISSGGGGDYLSDADFVAYVTS